VEATSPELQGPCADDEVGVLLANPRSGLDAASVSKRGAFAEGDTWITTDHRFRCDNDGEYWFVDNRNIVIQSVRGPAQARRLARGTAESK
jgi:putative long chain acyl-CoA synthase